MRLFARSSLLLLLLAGPGRASTIVESLSASTGAGATPSGTSLQGSATFQLEVLAGTYPPDEAPPGYGAVTIDAAFGSWTLGACTFTEGSDGECAGNLNDSVSFDGASIVFGFMFHEGTNGTGDDFYGYGNSCEFPDNAVPQTEVQPTVTCFLPAGTYTLILNLSESLGAVGDYSVTPGTASVTATLSGDVIDPAPEPGAFALAIAAAVFFMAKRRLIS